MATTAYDGWTISCGFLTGNLGDVPPATYEAALRAELQATFPGATIETPSQDAEGSVPHDLQPHAITPDGREPEGWEAVRDVFDAIERAQGRAWEQACRAAV
jgi:hypothetical protein